MRAESLPLLPELVRGCAPLNTTSTIPEHAPVQEPPQPKPDRKEPPAPPPIDKQRSEAPSPRKFS